MLRDSKTGNHIASNLEPEKQELRLQEHGLRIQSQYPDDVIFTTAETVQAGRLQPGTGSIRFVKLTPVKGKVFRSDSGEVISNSYILLTSEKDDHFDTRTDEKGEYVFGGVPPANYTVSIISLHGFEKGVKFPARIPKNKRRRTAATLRSNGNGRVRHSWKSSNSKAFPSNWGGRMSKTSIWWAGKAANGGVVRNNCVRHLNSPR